LVPDFFEELRSRIRNQQPSLVVISTQDEDAKGTYFHSELLPGMLPEIGYALLKRKSLDGIGEAASGVILPGIPTGEPRGSALRISIYARDDILPDLQGDERRLDNLLGDDGQIVSTCEQPTHKSGAIASYVWHPTYGHFAFIAMHIPVGTSALNVGNTLGYDEYRAATQAINQLCLLKVYNKLVSSLPTDSRPDHIFLMGDLNYDVEVPGKAPQDVIKDLAVDISAGKLKDLQRYDELRRAKTNVPLRGFKEGVSDEGPLFMPTWSLARGRPDTCAPDKLAARVDVNCFTPPIDAISTLGWHDRILYRELLTSGYITQCREYNRIDIKNMHASTHAGVIGFFEMGSLGQPAAQAPIQAPVRAVAQIAQPVPQAIARAPQPVIGAPVPLAQPAFQFAGPAPYQLPAAQPRVPVQPVPGQFPPLQPLFRQPLR
jgi:hypothetical protein